jgi:NDP-sugar pyrophosphorylase family protein
LSIKRIADTAEVTQKPLIGNDSVVGEYTKVGEKSSVKRSIIGAHCVIGKNVKIANSIIMDHVVIEDGVKLDGCIVCNNAKILDGSSLTKCDIAGGYIVERKSKYMFLVSSCRKPLLTIACSRREWTEVGWVPGSDIIALKCNCKIIGPYYIIKAHSTLQQLQSDIHRSILCMCN